MKPGSKTRTRQTLGGGTKTVTRTKSSTGAKTRTVERTKGDFHKGGLDVKRKIVRRDKSGVSKIKSSGVSWTNEPSGTGGVALAQNVSYQYKNTFRKKGSLKSKKQDLKTSYSNIRKDVGGWKKTKSADKPFIDTSVKVKDNSVRGESTWVKKEESRKDYKRSSEIAKGPNVKRNRSKANENLGQMKHREKAYLGTHGATRMTNEEASKLHGGKKVDLSKQQETGKTYTPKRK